MLFRSASQPAQARVPVSKAENTPQPLDEKPATTPLELQTALPKKLQSSPSAAQAPSPPQSIAETISTAKHPSLPSNSNGSVILASGTRVAVPSFTGEPVRKVIEQAGGIGLGVQVLGTGIARGQAPAAGTMVPVGTEVVVRFGR